MALKRASMWRSGAPARPDIATVLSGTAISIAGLTALVALGFASGHMLLLPPLAGSMALIAGAPTLPLAQPRNVVGGQLLSASVGLGLGLVSHSLWAAAIAGGLAFGVMALARMTHSPAAATAIIAVMHRVASLTSC
jgi:CBS-domain-containing membrane protein